MTDRFVNQGIEDKPVVPGNVKSDDDAYSVQFDAASWIEQASSDEIVELARCGWGGDYPADYVAFWMRSRVTEIDDLLSHCERRTADGNKCGFWCSLDRTAAHAWLMANRPDIAPLVRETEKG